MVDSALLGSIAITGVQLIVLAAIAGAIARAFNG